ncbi:response regulator transcription factor [Streptomyces sp. NBC_00338]|uniref:response regulator transcription factor n=1 Tax=unclassified Streptomyces TaxID=2593676 RepID=UPI0022549ADF|nr:response regulator transcription factor [Streptomyces sp. NBC_00338]MCX5142540.1 response regulator transcription factor [Streptomyces sp. NBC_00338]WSU60995.1 response regulator transcription factor [Streptomyces sp. NBC_01104]
MSDEISRSSGEQWTQQPHVSQHTSSHPSPLSSPPTGGVPTPDPPGGFPAFPSPEAMPVARPLRVVVADDNPVVRAGLTVLLHGRDDIDVVAEAGDGRQAYEMAVQHRPDVVLLDVRMPGVDGISALPHLVRLAPVLMMTYSRESEIVHEALRLGAGGYLVHGEFTADQLVAAVRDTKDGRAHFTYSASSALLESVRGGGGQAQDGRPLPEGLGTAFTGPGYRPVVPQGQVSAPAHDTHGGWGPGVGGNQQVGVVRPELGAHGFPQKASLPQSSVAHSSSGVPAAAPQGVPGDLSEREVEVMDLIASGMTNQQIAATCFISQKTVKNHINRIFAKLNAGSRGEAIAVWHRMSSGGSTRHG